jgi:hypothetical protein
MVLPCFFVCASLVYCVYRAVRNFSTDQRMNITFCVKSGNNPIETQPCLEHKRKNGKAQEVVWMWTGIILVRRRTGGSLL